MLPGSCQRVVLWSSAGLTGLSLSFFSCFSALEVRAGARSTRTTGAGGSWVGADCAGAGCEVGFGSGVGAAAGCVVGSGCGVGSAVGCCGLDVGLGSGVGSAAG